MNERLIEYLDGLFSPYEDSQTSRELKEELLNNLQDKLVDFKNQGYDDETAYHKTIVSIGDISEILETMPSKGGDLVEMVEKDFSDTDLQDYDLKRVRIHNGQFNDSTLKGADFSGSDLTNSSVNFQDRVGKPAKNEEGVWPARKSYGIVSSALNISRVIIFNN